MAHPRPPREGAPLRERLLWHATRSLEHGAGCAVVLLRPRSSARPGRAGRVAAPLAEAADRLRALLRQGDAIEVEATAAIGLVLHGSDEAGARAVHGRLCRTLSAVAAALVERGAHVRDLTLTFGHASVASGAPGRVDPLLAELLQGGADSGLRLAIPLESPEPARRGRPAMRGRPAGGPAAGLAALSMPAEDYLSAELRRRADALGVPYVRLSSRAPAMPRLLRPDLACELRAVPIGRKHSVLTVAMEDPGDREAIGRLAAATGLTIFPVLAAAAELRHALEVWGTQDRPGDEPRVGVALRPPAP